MKGSIPIIETCLALGAPLNLELRDRSYKPISRWMEFCEISALHLAIRFRHVEVVEWLLKRGAKADGPGRDENTSSPHPLCSPFDLAICESVVDCNKGYTGFEEQQKAGMYNNRVFRALLRRGVNVNVRDSQYKTLLAHAMRAWTTPQQCCFTLLL
ncbi:hypothetical protein QQZ08_006636 [Neonectria magnoliae]|uniref:Uncharacterized protein n=1 Tax=Neonectria magnoliae TaxID=2732573 RepID=A0ABR1I1I6_9HYPO